MYKIVLVLFNVVLGACVNPVGTLVATGISWFKRGRADRGNGHLLHMYCIPPSKHLGAKKRSNSLCNLLRKTLVVSRLRLRRLLVVVESTALLIGHQPCTFSKGSPA